jgi:hypothetical protein
MTCAGSSPATDQPAGVDYGQGWYFGRPSSVDDLLSRDIAVAVPAQGSAAVPAPAG